MHQLQYQRCKLLPDLDFISCHNPRVKNQVLIFFPCFFAISVAQIRAIQSLILQLIGTILGVRGMNKSCVSIANKQFSNRQNLYLKDPKSDTFVILNEKIYPLHREFLIEIHHFARKDLETTKVYLVDIELDQKLFEAVIGYFYGKQLKFFRDWDLLKLLDITTALDIPSLAEKIICDLKQNFDEYGFFLTMQIGQKFHIKWLQQKCQQELLMMGFEQMNFNRYDLLQVNQIMFEQILKLHQLLRINQNITGLKQNQLKKIIKQYCANNSLDDSEFNRLCLFLITDAKTLKPEKSKQLTKKMYQAESNQKLATQSKKIKQNGSEKSYQEKLQNLRTINTKIQQEGKKLIQEMKNVNRSSNQKCVKLENDIEEQIKKLQKVYQEQDVKYLNLKAEMQKLNSCTRKSEQSDSQSKAKRIDSSTGSTKDNERNSNRSRKLSDPTNQKFCCEMPRLSRDLD